MRNETTPAIRPYFFLLVPIFFLPLCYVHQVTGQWNPFAVSGKQFLVFYGGCMILGYVMVLVPVLFRQYTGLFPLLRGMVIALLVVGVARLCQGVYHGKPVGYLVLLLISLQVLWLFMGRYLKKKR